MNNGISIDMTISAQRQSNKPIQSPFFSRKVHSIVKKLRKSFTILLASFAIVLSTTHLHNSPAHASTTITATKTSTTSLLSKLNIFRPRTADELIDKYIQERLFIDDAFDPVESAYREAFSDYPSNGREGVYPQLLAETAASALGRKDGSSLIISKSAASQSDAGGITGALIQASDFLQQKLKVSSSVSYYIIAAGLLLGGTVLPGIVGMSYQAFQRLQIDKSEMKMYGKITDIAAIAKKVTEDDKAGSDEDDADEGEEGENDDDDDDE
ncbi:hypothetical protein ACHAWO_003630 [Cyclotella atomus]|uniref:Uncharacterized protein n=1 Tax=Cyclotella atomus TaxID=382360 RepID=A0ABD3QQ96_9STRA